MLFSVSASPPLAVPPTMLSFQGCGPSEMYSSMHPEVGSVLLTSTLAGGGVLVRRMDEGGRGNDFFFVVVQGFHRCIKICTVLFTFSWFGYRN